MDILIQHKLPSFSLDLSFQTNSKEITAIHGPSGSGKSTLIRLISGLEVPGSGHIIIKGNTLYDSLKKINLSPQKRRLGCIFQDSQLFPHLSVKSNLEYGFKRCHPEKRWAQWNNIIEILDLPPLLSRMPNKLSGGEKQRVSIGRALLMSPIALLMDEPLNSLDSNKKTDLLPYIKQVNTEFQIPILYVSHFMDEIHFLTNNILHMQNGVLAKT